MGSCVSRPGVMSTAKESVHELTAKVVDLDGAMAQFAAPVTAHEALAAAAAAAAARGASSHFLCCSDELYFDAPVRALGARDALQAGQLYFLLPLPMLHRPLSGQDMAALVVKAIVALSAAPVGAAIDAGRVSTGVPSRDKSGVGAGAAGKQRRQTGRVAPLDVVSGDGSGHADGECKRYHVNGGYDARNAVHGDRTLGKTRNGAGHEGVTRRLAPVQRLSVIVEAASE
ncbi:uncharacterized protein LOC133897462 [Phragmites australis]|uniref:uncharacterized protein LOC133897462 n=1 Tax=Phragmites australis TaxID=29695 RepID=UPI002D76BA97|nr:uncharacterized protein LOC133897462 [Phragmites australis]